MTSAAQPTAEISASPIEGLAPLPVQFDASLSSDDATSYFWEFGDGGASTAQIVTHIYNVAGTYTARLTVTSSEGSSTKEITITARGTGDGPVTGDMNFRLAITNAVFKFKSTQNADSLYLTAAFNTVDLPDDLRALAVSFSINNLFTLTGNLGDQAGFESPARRKPFFSVLVNRDEQLLTIFISKANLKSALLPDPSDIEPVPGGALAHVNFRLTIGAQTYSLTEEFKFSPSATNPSGAKFTLRKGIGAIHDGFFVISRASALENLSGKGHFFEFDSYLSRPMEKLITGPVAPTVQAKYVATAPIALSGLGTVDGVALLPNDMVLVTAQAQPVQNGLYRAQAGSWERTDDALKQDMLIAISKGTTQALTRWRLDTPDPIVRNSTEIQFVKANPGTFSFTFNDADTQVLLFDSLRRRKDELIYEQSDRDLGGINRLTINVITRRMIIRTWDLERRVDEGGTGLPPRGQSFTAFNFTLRLDFDQPDGTTFQAVTATRLTRRTREDAFWQTGRRNRR